MKLATSEKLPSSKKATATHGTGEKLPYSKRLLPDTKLVTGEKLPHSKRLLPEMKLVTCEKITLLEKATASNETGNQ